MGGEDTLIYPVRGKSYAGRKSALWFILYWGKRAEIALLLLLILFWKAARSCAVSSGVSRALPQAPLALNCDV